MNRTNQKLVNDLKQLLDNYLNKSNSKDLIKVLDEDISIQTFSVSDIVELDKTQLEYEPPRGIDYRIILDKIITHCEKLLSEEKYLRLVLDVSELMFFAGELSYSLEITEILLDKIKDEVKYANVHAETNLMISKIYWSQAYWDECHHYVSEAGKIFESIESKPGLAKCENMLGTFYGERGEFNKAETHLMQALNYLSVEDDLSSRAMIFTNLGIIKTINKDYEKAIWNYKNAAEAFNKLNDTRRLARVFHNVGMLYTKMESFDAALDEFNKCITLSLENDYISNCAVAYIGKAYIYVKLKNQALADAYTDKAMELAYNLNDTLSIADIYRIKGMIQNDLNNFELSEEMFENSIRLNRDTESKLNEAESSIQMGELLKKRNRSIEAKPYLETAQTFFYGLKSEKKTSGLVELSI